jgi:hypothetical protein
VLEWGLEPLRTGATRLAVTVYRHPRGASGLPRAGTHWHRGTVRAFARLTRELARRAEALEAPPSC